MSAAAVPDDPVFEGSVESISDSLAEEMSGVSWHPGCPVRIADLRVITMSHWGLDGAVHRGELVVHQDVATDILAVFSQLFDAHFPIRRMERIDVYAGDDDASMAANNTAAFNCREITGGETLSVHSWGKAIDINPLENPYVRDEIVLPPAGAAFVDREDVRPGMILDGDVVVKSFATIGFIWGGNWDRLKDYQHFESADPWRDVERVGRTVVRSVH